MRGAVGSIYGPEIDVGKRTRITDPLSRRVRDMDMYRLKLAGYTYAEIGKHYRLSLWYVLRRIQALPPEIKDSVRRQFRRSQAVAG